MNDPILDFDAAVPEESIVDQKDAAIAFRGGGTFEEDIQDCGDQVL